MRLQRPARPRRPARPQRPRRPTQPRNDKTQQPRQRGNHVFVLCIGHGSNPQGLIDQLRQVGIVAKRWRAELLDFEHERWLFEWLTEEEAAQLWELPNRPRWCKFVLEVSAAQAHYAEYQLARMKRRIIAGTLKTRPYQVDEYTILISEAGIAIWKQYAALEDLALERRKQGIKVNR